MQYHYEVSGSPDATTIGFGVTLVRPQSRGRVRLASANPFEPPVIDPRYLENERDMSAMVSGVELTQRFLQTKTFSSIIKQDGSFGLGKLTREDIESYLRANISTIYHPTGTCKMGSDATAVVDSELRVRGIDGLRVVDASIMPTITTGNTNAPTIMIAYKAASMIRRKLTSEHGTERREVAA
jgi:choline dehydrogenase